MSKFRMTKRERIDHRAVQKSENSKALPPDDPPEDIDKFRDAMARKIVMFVGDTHQCWRGCPERICRRARACFAPRGECVNLPPAPPTTPEQDARARAQFLRELKIAMARNEAEEK